MSGPKNTQAAAFAILAETLEDMPTPGFTVAEPWPHLENASGPVGVPDILPGSTSAVSLFGG